MTSSTMSYREAIKYRGDLDMLARVLRRQTGPKVVLLLAALLGGP